MIPPALIALVLAIIFAFMMYHLSSGGPVQSDPFPDDIYFEDDDEDEEWENQFDPYKLREPSDLNNFYDLDVDQD